MINVFLIVFADVTAFVSIEAIEASKYIVLFGRRTSLMNQCKSDIWFGIFDFTCATYGFYISTSAEYDVYLVRDANT